jgi:hypothetical protein
MLISFFIIYSVHHTLAPRTRLVSYRSLFLCRTIGRHRKVDGDVAIFIHKAQECLFDRREYLSSITAEFGAKVLCSVEHAR